MLLCRWFGEFILGILGMGTHELSMRLLRRVGVGGAKLQQISTHGIKGATLRINESEGVTDRSKACIALGGSSPLCLLSSQYIAAFQIRVGRSCMDYFPPFLLLKRQASVMHQPQKKKGVNLANYFALEKHNLMTIRNRYTLLENTLFKQTPRPINALTQSISLSREIVAVTEPHPPRKPPACIAPSRKTAFHVANERKPGARKSAFNGNVSSLGDEYAEGISSSRIMCATQGG